MSLSIFISGQKDLLHQFVKAFLYSFTTYFLCFVLTLKNELIGHPQLEDTQLEKTAAGSACMAKNIKLAMYSQTRGDLVR